MYSTETPLQRYSSTLAAYTLKQFSDARTALDSHQAAAAKLPAINSYDYRLPKSTTDSSSAQSSPRQSPINDQDSDTHDDQPAQ